tara:strand:+ start:68 stop:751 length:684 start_codon:yes stop_codon:yes gene_type:complete
MNIFFIDTKDTHTMPPKPEMWYKHHDGNEYAVQVRKELENDKVKIHFIGWNNRHDMTVQRCDLKTQPQKKTQSQKKTQKRARDDYDDDEEDAAPQDAAPQDAAPQDDDEEDDDVCKACHCLMNGIPVRGNTHTCSEPGKYVQRSDLVQIGDKLVHERHNGKVVAWNAHKGVYICKFENSNRYTSSGSIVGGLRPTTHEHEYEELTPKHAEAAVKRAKKAEVKRAKVA